MADRVDIHCRFHEQYPYQLYCKDCRDFACLECLVEKHQKHTMCKLEDAVNDIRKEIQTFINDEHEGEPKIDYLEELLDQKESEIQNVESEITNKIEDAVEILKREINIQKECLLTNLTRICYSRRQSINLLRNRVKYATQNLANFNTNAKENNLYEMMHLLSEIKACSEVRENIGQMLNPPSFEEIQSKCKIGYLRDGSELSTDQANSELNFAEEGCQKDHVISTSVGTQTEDDDTDSENDWFDAEDTNDVETSSDEIREEYPLSICFEKDSKINNIHKIVPISNQDAWILSNGNLRKLTKLAIEDDIYACSVDDFLLLKDGSILIVSKQDVFIKKLLQNKRMVRFADVVSCSYRSIDCFCEDKDGYIFLIYRVFSLTERYQMHHLVKLNNLGMLLSQKNWDSL